MVQGKAAILSARILSLLLYGLAELGPPSWFCLCSLKVWRSSALQVRKERDESRSDLATGSGVRYWGAKNNFAWARALMEESNTITGELARIS